MLGEMLHMSQKLEELESRLILAVKALEEIAADCKLCDSPKKARKALSLISKTSENVIKKRC